MITHHHRYMSHVPRWGIVPTSRVQSVAEHSYYVSLYVMEMLKLPAFDHWTSDRKFCAVRYALVHDVAEARMSDIPGPVKRMIKDPAKYEETELRVTRDMGFVDKYGQDYYTDEEIKALVKVADLIDEYLYLNMEAIGGNGHIKTLLPQVWDRLTSAIFAFELLGPCLNTVQAWVVGMVVSIRDGVDTLQNDTDVKPVCVCPDAPCAACEIPF